MKQIRRRFTYANTMSTIAVFLVLGGATAAAASQLGKNTVGAKQLKNNAVTSAKIKKEAVTGAKIKKGSVTGANLNLSSLGTVPSATNASHATSADTAKSADIANSSKNTTGLAGPLASGQTLTGTVGSAGHQASGGDFIDETAISFQIPLASAPTLHLVPEGGPPTAQCPGTAQAPKAQPGSLCIYAELLSGATEVEFGSLTRFGATLFLEDLEPAPVDYELEGVWAVTAP